MVKFAERLTETLKLKGLSFSAFARRIKVTPNTVCKWCNGDREPNYEMLLLITKELEESTDYLLGLSD
ncbi:MAG: helix-turn-helix domain-containing protein [Christensenellaceae bacterium]|jgi:transcriptional regulator with XRE-family HTH domain|nr:helix-turn-helix domain-containing protein [Christensenellaceae bacterium]